MDQAEHARQAQAIAEKLDEFLQVTTEKYDAGTILSIMLGRSVALCKMLRESGGGFDREAAISYFGTALAQAAEPDVPADDEADSSDTEGEGTAGAH